MQSLFSYNKILGYFCCLKNIYNPKPHTFEETTTLINNPSQDYTCNKDDILRSGKFSVVYSGYSNCNKKKVAIKVIELDSKANMSHINVFNEVIILKMLQHPNINNYIHHYVYNNCLFIVQELCSGGDLFDYIETNVVSELETRAIIKHICLAVQYCHNKNIVHRDIKPENIMFATSRKIPKDIRLIDFGLSKIINKPESNMKSSMGTVYYMSPEVIRRYYTKKCDIWSIGVIMYSILYDGMPFNNNNDILNLNYIKPPINNNISKEALCLIDKIFVDEDDRISIDEILRDEWLSKV